MKTNLLKSLFISLIFVMGVGSMNAANTMRIYCKNTQSWWKSDGAAVGAYYWGTGGNANSWPGTRMTKVDGQTDLWYIDVDIDKYQNIIFTRVNGSGSVSDWGAKTNDLTIGNTKNQYKITQSSGAWDGAKSAGTWETYKPTSTATLATSAANIIVGGQATLTSSLTSNASANTIKETAYAISPAGANVNGNTFTATAAGTYTVTATVTYYPLGCPTLTSTATATATITVKANDTYSLTVAAGAGIASVTGSTDPVTLGSTYAITATPKTGYTFSTWTADPAANATFGSETTASTTVTVKNGSVTVTASATENMSTLTTSNNYDAGDPGYEVPAASVNSIGYETTATITATTDDDYTLTSWTLTNCTRTDGGLDNATTITVRSNGDGKAATVIANYSKIPTETVYFINTPKWTGTINAYAWTDGTPKVENAGWAGLPAKKEDFQIGEYEVYSYTATQGKYANVIFNGSGGQTADLAWTSGKYYIHNYNENTGWYTQAEAEDILVVPVVEETVYFVNNRKWSKVQAYAWNPTGNNSWPGVALAATGEKIAGFDVYSYTAPQGYINVIFNNKTGDDGVQSADFKWTDGKYYYMDAAANYAGGTIGEVTTAVTPYALATDVYLAGQMNSWSTTANEFRKATGEATTASVTVALEKQDYAFKLVIGGAWKGNNGTMQRGGDGVHEGGWSFDDDGNCTIIADIAGDYTFTWNLETKKLTVTYPELPTYTVTATAENGTVTGAGEYKYGTEATLVATPNAGYAFVNWKKGEEVVSSEAFYTFTVTANTDLVAVFAPEETHEVTISYLCNSNPIPGHDAHTLAVGVTTPSTITAPAITHYTFDSWTVGTGVLAVDAKANPIQITTKAEGDYTLAANYTKIELTYNVQVPDGTEKCFIAGSMNGWSFTEMTKIDDTHYTITIDGATKEMEYKYACQASWDYEELQANGSSVSNRKWSAKDVVAKWKDPLATNVYLAGDMTNWGEGQLQFRKKAAGDAVATVSVELTEGEHKFKIIEDGKWLGNNGTMTREYHENWTFREKQDDRTTDEVDATIYADENGIYTFTWNSTDNKLTVTYPAPTAKYIYFKNNPGWSKVYVYFFNEENFGDLGASSYGLTIANKRVAAMTRIENTDIWQYEYGTTGITPSNVIAFTEASQPNYSNFNNTKAVYRSDFNKKMELFIPQKTSNETKNGTKYYSNGVWMKYNATESGYSLDVTDEPNKPDFTTENVGGYVFSTTIRLNASKTYKFKIPNVKGDKFATSKSITFAKNNNDVELTTDVQDDVTIKTNTAGVYTFMIDLSSGKLKLSVDYPLADGDYRLAYKENDGTKNTKFHPAQYIRKVTEDTKLDIVSFYINKEGNNPAIVLQQASVDNAGKVKWNNVDSTLITLSTIESGVYNVALQQTNEGSHQATILCNDETYPQPYTGHYYIRTDAANGGWGFYEQETNQMEYTNLNADYDYYYCKWFNNPTGNVRFVVANDYSECVSDTMTTDTFLDDGEKLLGESANVRFAWSSKTNTTSRAYLAGSGSNDEYLTISGTNIYSNEETPVDIVKSKFVDQNDWVYALDIKAKHGAVIDVIAKYKGKESTFIDNQNIMSTQAGDENFYTLRVIYNFKTNNIVSSWLLQNVEQNMALSADIMMIRNGQGSPNQLKLNGHKISGDPKTVYGVMQFDKSDITDNNKSIEERGLYWISFPFDVNLVDVFGLGEYGTAWIIQYYDGEERAQKGWFQETSTFWKYVMPEERKNFVLEANVGYGLALDIEAIEWPHGIEQQNLYFPSADRIETISTELTSTSVYVKPLTCTIERDDRNIKDSHWNVIGVPSFANAEDILSQEGLKYLYEWNSTDNKLTASQATRHTFQAMHSYMVQFAGTIDWELKGKTPAALAAKAPAKESTLLQLTLTEGDKQLDQTYVELTDEATAAFDMNMDLTKFFNTGHANIYSCIQTVPVAANMLPVQSVQVPLGIQVVKEGSYTIALPASVDAALVTLIDNQTQTHTCLNTSDYTVTLPAGTYENRFFLAVEPQRVVTSNPTNEQDTEPTVKFIKDGQLYILHQGVIYDAQGRR